MSHQSTLSYDCVKWFKVSEESFNFWLGFFVGTRNQETCKCKIFPKFTQTALITLKGLVGKRMHNRLFVLLDETQDEVNQHLQDFLWSLSNAGFCKVVLNVFNYSLVLKSDLICFIHDHQEMGEVKVVCFMQRPNTVHDLLLHPICNASTLTSLWEDWHIERSWSTLHVYVLLACGITLRVQEEEAGALATYALI